mgnify:CR=1 FL=1
MAKHIIWGVLNWGLGHATRSAPLIRQAVQMGWQVTLASDGKALHWLQKEFPNLPTISLPSYGIKQYNTHYSALPLFSMLPAIYKAARAEHRILQQLANQNSATIVISDNRLGFYHPTVASYYISHQLHIPGGIWQRPASALHRYYYRNFKQLLVPDTPEATLSGLMAQSPGTGQPVHYLGWPSRFRKCTIEGQEITIILSGPEPQRSRWEKQLLKALSRLSLSVNVVGSSRSIYRKEKNLNLYPVLNTEELQGLFERSRLIISRCGYTTLLDLAVTGKRALLVPTPGQWEQQYLALRLKEKGWLHPVQEHKLDIEKDIERALQKPPLPFIAGEEHSGNFKSWLQGAIVT